MRRGFTLIELLVVISIIAVLSTVGFTAFSGIQAKARDAIRKNDLNTLATALEVYYEQNQKYIGTPGQDGSCAAGTDDFYNQIASKIDGPVPIDPKTGEKYLYTAENKCQSYRFFAKLENCQGSAGNLCDYTNYTFSVISDDLAIDSAPGDTIASLPTPTPAPAWTENWDSLSGVQSRWSSIGSACYSVPQPGILDMVCQSAGLVSKQYFDKSQTIEVSGRVRAQPAQGSATDAYWGAIAIYQNDGSDTKYGTIAMERNVPPFGGDHTSRVVSLTDDARPAILSASAAWQWHDFKIVYSPDGSYRYYVDGTLRDTKTNALLPANPDIFVLCVSVGEGTVNDGSAAQCQFGPITVKGVLTTVPTSTPASTPTPTPTTLKVFVTNASYTGNLGRLFGADQKCQQAADAVSSLQGKLWRAWLSDSNTSAKDRVSDGRFIRIDNAVVAQNKQDLLDGNLLTPINVTETGGTPSVYAAESNSYVWTGTDASGNATSYNCANWDQPQAASGTLGLANATDSRWTNGAVGNDPQCQTYQRHLYCFEQPAPSQTGGTGCLTAYQDFDNDGYTVSNPVYFCNTTTLPYGYKSSSSTTADCYDQNPNAKPGQTQFFSTHRGDGSFDYNCDGAVSPQYSNVGVSCYGYSVTKNSNCSFTNPTFTCFIGSATTASNCGQQGGWTGNSPAGYYMWNEADCDLTNLADAANEKLACK